MRKDIYKMILLKEWIKVRKLFLIPFIVLIAFVIDTYMKYDGFISMHGAANLWFELIYKQGIHFIKLEWALIGGGVWFACLQFVPECKDKRLRLLFQMPISYKTSIYTMLGLGVVYVLSLLVFSTLGLFLIFNNLNFPSELYTPMIKTIFPWGVAALCAYFATAATIAEPKIIRKIGFVFVACVYVSLLTSTNGYDAMSKDLWKYIFISVFWIFVFESAALRTKEGQA
jgi:hypothetical protein